MNLKGFNPSGILPFLDVLANKVPPGIASIIKKVLMAILGIFAIAMAYYGWMLGKDNANQEGQSLAETTRSLFLEDIEREYNRKRRDIRMPETSEVLNQNDYGTRMKYEFSGRENRDGQPKLTEEDKAMLENERGFRSMKRKGNGPPMLSPREGEEGYSNMQPGSDLPGVRIPDNSEIKGGLERGNEDIIHDTRKQERRSRLLQKDKNFSMPSRREAVPGSKTELVEEKGILRQKNNDDLRPSEKKEKRKLLPMN
ncbi:MAG: hypothetical protein K8R21_00135 [Leptospira sp.]|nr:hypothetical protein [Leptospira sp.]